jgi:hypothetical protein
MRLFRGLAGALLWIVASLLALVAVILCVTVILLPVGLPLLNLSRKLFGQATRLMLPRALAHPVKQAKGKARAARKDLSPSRSRAKMLKDSVEEPRKKLKKGSRTTVDAVAGLAGKKRRGPWWKRG